jgi:hypothetical protein
MVNDKLCTVCGYEMEEGPRDFNICPSCGTEFGLYDLNSSIPALRALWLSNGPVWHSSVVPKPSGWSPIRQLADMFLNPVAMPAAALSHPSPIVIRARSKRKRWKVRYSTVKSAAQPFGLTPSQGSQAA